ncbi:TetR/AcrR family transcriptional regulator [Nocardioides sp. zg-536]|uniref:TetR/AcrR family transcriptional regulator n=1 Tax=Nocardioides faecalis TaxID=2803858 RepID=A0A939BWD1_9ACTN|nr:TetR/AcrR family transcriptional regulator [Nocardioides faecalis]MBM9460901.1 TetR/AcrR family transcriptional regulator [Nocardioides faecalis]MBS4751876.1 TetR/AcrR family transcriptional regulator [Nocardioides faecalis]QVI59274.1 TetR/AcrR family transcriptional regulator [Nocardioides faecalis]
MPPRAAPLSVEDRRERLVATTLELLHEHGPAVTTRRIAEAAGVAEGTIFRVFASKDELVTAAVCKAFEPGGMLADLQAIDPEATLRERTLALVRILQQRYSGSFALLHRLGLPQPPAPADADSDGGSDGGADGTRRAGLAEETMHAMAEVFAPHADELTMPPAEVARLLRLLTFTGTHPRLAGGDLLSTDQIVDTVLYGVLRREAGAPPTPSEDPARSEDPSRSEPLASPHPRADGAEGNRR